jgi:peptidoglycan/xylan/chitin deacetylase (PgdA/CDA1 family)
LASWQAAALRVAAQVASPGGARGSLLVLMYHRVLPEPDPLLADEPDAASFAAQMDLIAGLLNVVSLPDAVEALARGALPPRAAAITFDDGYANNLDVAVPILLARRLTATFYVTTGFIDGGSMWNDLVIDAVRRAPAEFDLSGLGCGRYTLDDTVSRRRAIDDVLGRLKYLELPERLRRAEAIAARAGVVSVRQPMMSEAQLRELAACGMDIGAHCVSHPILARVPSDIARREIFESRRRLEAIVASPVRTFAYPNGRPRQDYGPEHVAMVREAGFSAAVSTAWGAVTRGADLMQIPRVAPWDRHALKYGLRLVRAFAERDPAVV